MINIVNEWEISNSQANKDDTAFQNSQEFNSKIKSGQTLYLSGSADPYLFDIIEIIGKDDVEFYGDPDTVIKFWKDRNFLQIENANNFNIHDLIFDGREAENEGGVWAKNGSTNGILKNLEIREADEVSCVISGTDTHHVTVEDCTVHGQRNWSSNAKAMFLAGGDAEHITFKKCKTFSQHHYDDDKYSPADHFDTDNATNVEYHNCTADGSGHDEGDGRKGAGFWNEAGGPNSPDHESSSTYYDCKAIETGGGLSAAENSDIVAHNFTFDNCSFYGWAAWARCCGNFELYDSVFDGCAGIGGSLIKRGGFVIEGAPEGKFIKFKRNEFKNTPEGKPHYDNINLYSKEVHEGDIEIGNNTFDDNVTANPNSAAKNTVYIYENTFSGSDANLNKNESQTDYNWIENAPGGEKKSATTTAVNSPTSSATVNVVYQSHFTTV